jgi:hypothetical protein
MTSFITESTTTTIVSGVLDDIKENIIDHHHINEQMEKLNVKNENCMCSLSFFLLQRQI